MQSEILKKAQAFAREVCDLAMLPDDDDEDRRLNKYFEES